MGHARLGFGVETALWVTVCNNTGEGAVQGVSRNSQAVYGDVARKYSTLWYAAPRICRG